MNVFFTIYFRRLEMLLSMLLNSELSLCDTLSYLRSLKCILPVPFLLLITSAVWIDCIMLSALISPVYLSRVIVEVIMLVSVYFLVFPVSLCSCDSAEQQQTTAPQLCSSCCSILEDVIDIFLIIMFYFITRNLSAIIQNFNFYDLTCPTRGIWLQSVHHYCPHTSYI